MWPITQFYFIFNLISRISNRSLKVANLSLPNAPQRRMWTRWSLDSIHHEIQQRSRVSRYWIGELSIVQIRKRSPLGSIPEMREAVHKLERLRDKTERRFGQGYKHEGWYRAWEFIVKEAHLFPSTRPWRFLVKEANRKEDYCKNNTVWWVPSYRIASTVPGPRTPVG